MKKLFILDIYKVKSKRSKMGDLFPKFEISLIFDKLEGSQK